MVGTLINAITPNDITNPGNRMRNNINQLIHRVGWGRSRKRTKQNGNISPQKRRLKSTTPIGVLKKK